MIRVSSHLPLLTLRLAGSTGWSEQEIHRLPLRRLILYLHKLRSLQPKP
jgi:hypothetical protein